MITGFNTDIKHDGVVYHVQTEDKGPENPLLLSLVYVGGHILAAKRTNYAKEQAEGISEKQLQEKLEKQHKLILAIISRGRIQDLVALREREIQAEKEAKERGGPEAEVVPQVALPAPPPVLAPQPVPPVAPAPIHAAPPAGTTELLSPLLAQQLLPSLPPSPPPVEPPKGMTEMLSPLLAQQLESDSTQPVYPAEPASGITDVLSSLVSSGPPHPPVSSTPAGGSPTFTGSLDNLLQQVISTGRLPEETSPAAAPPPPRMTDTGSLTTGGLTSSGSLKAFREFDLDRIISEYLQTETKEEKPEIRLLGNTNFFAGDTVVLQVEVTRGATQTPMASTPVIVKILGTAFKPQTHSMLTGPDGIAMTTITLPNFTAGSAAIVIQTSTDSGEAEIKQLIRRR
ncbi:MAG: hypothetical protein K1Y36_20870 [Blastocatellia bacterium]|nr:hypothetical protein [Blastocatellia bacterium]